MLVKLTELTSAVDKVKVMASDMKQGIPGILLTANGDKLEVCYTDGRKSVYEAVSAEFEENEQFGSIIVPYKTFIDIIDICKPDGVIQVENVYIKINENNMVQIAVEKYVETEGADDSVVRKTVSKLKQEVKFNRPEDDKRQSILTRMDYSTMFNHETYDEWNRQRLISIIKRLAKEDDKVILVSGNKHAASVANLVYGAYIPCEEVKDCGFCVSSRVARNIVDILGKTSCDNIEIATMNQQYCTISAADKSVGIWFEMTKPSRMAIQVIEEYTSHNYDTCRLILMRPALENVVKCCNAVNNGNEAITLEFVRTTDGGLETKFGGIGTASKESDFSVGIEAYTGDPESLSIGINMSCLIDMLGLCGETYVAFDILCDERGKFLRVGDIEGKNDDGSLIVSGLYFTTVK